MAFLGETVVNVKDTPYAKYKKIDWIKHYITAYAGIDGSHHKDWVFDQIMRIIHSPLSIVEIKLAKWDDGSEEYRINLLDPSKEYYKMVVGTIEEGYEYHTGIAP